MRENKYRLWDKKAEQMIGWNDLYNREGIPKDWDMDDFLNGQEDDEYSEAMQYTGAHDFNGIEVYEGDIIGDTMGNVIGIVFYSTMNAQYAVAGLGFSEPLSEYSKSGIVVLGNKHENPTSLEKLGAD